MSAKVSITLEEDVLAFVDRFSKGEASPTSQNRSQFINQILSQEYKRRSLHELKDAYTSISNDPEYRSEVELWDVTVGDGIDA